MAPVYVRWQAQKGPVLTNLLNETLRIDEPGRLTLPLLDGSRDRAALRTAFLALLTTGSLALQVDGNAVPVTEDSPLVDQGLDAILQSLGRLALLQKTGNAG